MSNESSKVARIFEYLLAVKNLNEKIIRNVEEYDSVWWEENLPVYEGLYTGGSGTNGEAWLEVHRQEVPKPPYPPKNIQLWVSKFDNPDRKPDLKEKLFAGQDEEGNDIVISFDEDPERVASYKSWLKEWSTWAIEASIKGKIQKLYMEFFSIYQRFQREGEDLELVCGHGLLQWEFAGYKISRHVLVTKLELIFDAKKGIFYLIPTSKGTLMETDMLLHIDIPNATRLMQMVNEVSDFVFSPLNQEQLKPFLEEIVYTISPKGSYKVESRVSIADISSPVITYSSGFFLRNTGGRLWQQELARVIDKVKDGFPIPETIITLTSDKDDEQNSQQNYQQQLNTTNENWDYVGEQLLFPLPTNKEQQLIAQKLASNSGVVIQGPPGTGKSHTIANLISHLLAHGKKVLVTSEKERALQVLKAKIPEEIRSLCVSVLGGDSQSVKEIEDSIRNIAENLDSKQPEILQKNIERLTSELKTTKRNIARNDSLINEAAMNENTLGNFGELTLTPLEAAKWLDDNKIHAWLPDEVKPSEQFPLTQVELKGFFKHLGILSKEDIDSLSLRRPLSKHLASPSVFSQKVDDLLGKKEKVEQTREAIQNWTIKDISNLDFNHWIILTNKFIDKLNVLQQKKWLRAIMEECSKYPEQVEYWKKLHSEFYESMNLIQLLENGIIEYTFEFPSDIKLQKLKEDLLDLHDKLLKDNKVSWFYKNISGRKNKYLFNDVKVNDLPIRNADDVLLILKRIDLILSKQKLSLKWNRILSQLEGPNLEENQIRFVFYMKENCSLLEEVINWEFNANKQFNDLVNLVGKPGNPNYIDTKWFSELLNGLNALMHKIDWEKSNEFFDSLDIYISSGKDQLTPHQIWNDTYEGLKTLDKDKWKKSYTELVRLEGLEEGYLEFMNLFNKLFDILPKWSVYLREKGGEGTPLLPPEDLQNAFLWKQVDYWIKDLHSKSNIEQFEMDRKQEQLNEHKIIKHLVAESTWLKQINRTTTSQKRSLFAWLKAIQRIGKGTGKYANSYRKEASKEMMEAKGAIPVWIMPIQRVIENFELSKDLFDVIIVDESSQSNLFSLSVLLRAKKAIIVGDDNQISPDSVGTEISDIHELIERYLYDIPNKMQFDIRTSLYDTANRVFDSKIVLKEHYRCVPEIIQFSNDLMYGGKIDPLRLPLAHEMFDPPVKAIRVYEGYRSEGTSKAINEPEAEAIVNYIADCINNPLYDNKTFGVISLQGYDQARIIENMLREKIGEEEMINRRLITGDSYAFQGDERDIIFLSMVIAPNVRFNALSKRSDLQRFNVAASRARDQMILFHSVDLNQLSNKDVRYRLLQYCMNPYRVQDEMKKFAMEFDSQFERDVFTQITSRGYRVIPQVKVGTLGKRIDLVVEGLRTRLAVECDGDRWHGLDKWEEDVERQRVLERVGWTFWRVRGSAYYSNPTKAMESLWTKLDEMGIEPNLTFDDGNINDNVKLNNTDRYDLGKMDIQDLKSIN